MDTNLKTLQNQTLSAKALQSIEILKMNNTDLTAYINDLHIENPIANIDKESENKDEFIKKLDWLNSSNIHNKIYSKYNCDKDDEQNKYNLIYDESLYLTNTLLEQLHILPLPKEDINVCEFLIENLNDEGYLDCKEEVKAILKLNDKEIQKYIDIIQSFEPIGVGATNLAECLLIQLKKKQKVDNVIEKIILNDLQALSKNQFTTLKTKYNIDKDSLTDLLNIIKNLNPRPCSSFNRKEAIKYITPDVIVVKFENYFEVMLNNYGIPPITINKDYLNLAKNETDKKTKTYVQNKLKQIIHVQECINQRNTTLLNTVNAILEHQINFFKYGHGYLVPLKLNHIAEKLNIHESTVSRAIKNKYLQCSFGVFPLKYFFINKIESEQDNSCTPEKIKMCLEEIIKNEDTSNPYSDQKLTEILNESGITIKRRTVAKYRNQLLIPSASFRKS